MPPRTIAAFNPTSPNISVSHTPVVISLHGIRTRGVWQKYLASALAKEGFIPVPLDYGFFRGIQLVLPFLRDRKVHWLLEEYTRVTKEYNAETPSIIAHSFGTYLVAKTLEKYDEVKFDRVIFCGSIVRRDYPWAQIFATDQVKRVLNDYGKRDFWAKAAQWVVDDSGPSGAEGFEDDANSRVVQRVRPRFRHSDFFYELNYEHVWIPFLEGNDPPQVVAIPRRPPNWKFRVVLFAILILLFLGGWFGASAIKKFIPKIWPTPMLQADPLTGELGLEDDPSISVDGKDVAYSWDGKDGGTRSIYVKSVDIGDRKRLTQDPDGDVQSPVWSDTGLIYYVHPVADKDQIWVMTSSADKRMLLEIPMYPDVLGIHPGLAVSSGGVLAVPSRGTQEQEPGIFWHSLSSASSDWHRLTNAKGDFGDSQPSFSPNGKELAFAHSVSLGRDALCIVSVNGGPPHCLTNEAEHISGIAWMPNGNEIVFASDRKGVSALWRINKKGGTPKLIKIFEESIVGLSVSRQGNRLVFARDFSNNSIWQRAISSHDPTHDRAHKLISSAGGDDSPQYSPDGRKILFMSTRTGRTEIYTCNEDTSELKALTGATAPFTSSLLAGDSGPVTGTPRWSPSGKQIAFDSRRNPSGHSRIYVMDANGSNMHVAVAEDKTKAPFDDTVPSWSLDGEWMFFASTRRDKHGISGKNEIWKVQVTGGEPEQVTERGGFAPIPWKNGIVYYVKDPDNAPEIWQVPLNGGQEKKVIDNLGTGLWAQWTVTSAGIYFVKLESDGKYAIELRRIPEGKTDRVFDLDSPPALSTWGLSVSPDLHTILYTQKEARSQIMVVKNFH